MVRCGVAVEFAVVALTAAGSATEVELLPDPADPDLPATVTVTGPWEPDEEDRVLDEAIDARHTERAPFLPRPVPAHLLERLQAVAGPPGGRRAACGWVTPRVNGRRRRTGGRSPRCSPSAGRPLPDPPYARPS